MEDSRNGATTSFSESRTQGDELVLPIDREAFSAVALNLIERFKLNRLGSLDNANDAMLCILAALDQYHQGNTEQVDVLLTNQRDRAEQETRLLDALSKFETLAASTAVEFGRIDLALNRMEQIERELAMVKTDLETVAQKIQGTDGWSIALNFVSATLYVLLGAAITLLATHFVGKLHL
jgi:hypothetical protein